MLQLVGFDGDDTLWHSEGYYRQAGEAFAAIMARYVDVADRDVHERMLATEQRNLKLFGYGAKGMALSMVETAIAVSDGRIGAADIHALIELGKTVLQHPVELLPGIRAAVEALHAVVQLVAGRDDQHRRLATRGAQRFEPPHPVAIRQAEVEQQHIVAGGGKPLLRCGERAHPVHPEVLAEELVQRLSEVQVVFHQQQVHRQTRVAPGHCPGADLTNRLTTREPRRLDFRDRAAQAGTRHSWRQGDDQREACL